MWTSVTPVSCVECIQTLSDGMPGLPIFASTSTDTPIESLRKLVSSLPASSRPALFAHILNSLLITAARCLPNITHLLLGETSTRRAQRIISDTALGKGWSLPLELASAQTVPESKIITVRPMRDMTIKDTAIWCWGKCLETRNHLVWRSLISDGGGSGRHRVNGGAGSIEGLTESEDIPQLEHVWNAKFPKCSSQA